jgi:DNA recombination protein RmuC
MWMFSTCFAIGIGLFVIGYVMKRRLSNAQKQLSDSFKSLAFEVMERNSRVFLDLAKTTLDKYQEGAKTDLDFRHKTIEAAMEPLKESLKQIDISQRELEKKRIEAYASLGVQIEGMATAERQLRQEMSRLVQSLRSPQIRGSWGQVHLKRVIELSGMMNHCDFFEQKTVENEGKTWRPDLLIHLPGQRQIVIDAKTPLNAYLDASDEGDDHLRKIKLQEHAVALKRHMKDLSTKEYWRQFEGALEYVILFLPAEAFYSAALQADPELIEIGASQNILIATPTTLIAILRAIALMWKHESLSKNAKEISQLGQDLYTRISIFCDHWNKVGKHLNGSVEAFNQSAASLETRIMVTARKLKEAGQIHEELPEAPQIEKIARIVNFPVHKD